MGRGGEEGRGRGEEGAGGWGVEETNKKNILTMFPYSHEVLYPLVSAPNVVLVKAVLLQQPRSSTPKASSKTTDTKSTVKLLWRASSTNQMLS